MINTQNKDLSKESILLKENKNPKKIPSKGPRGQIFVNSEYQVKLLSKHKPKTGTMINFQLEKFENNPESHTKQC